MNPLIVIGLITALPIALILILGANASVVFLALCAGDLAAKYFGDDAVKLFQTFSSNTSPALYSGLRIGLLALPMLLTIIFLRRNIHGVKHVFNLIPTMLTGITTTLLVVPLLTDGLKGSIFSTSTWGLVTQMQGTIVGVAVVVSLLMLWTTQGHGKRDRRRHH